MSRITRKDLDICASLVREAQDIKERMQRLRSLAESTTAPFRDMPGGAVLSDKTGNGAIALADLEADARRRIQSYFEHAGEVDKAIGELADPNQRIILRLRYVDGLTWREVSEKANYEERQCRRIHGDALSALGVEKLPEDDDVRECPTQKNV